MTINDQWRLSVCFPGDPIPQARARFSGGHAFTPKRTRDAQKALAQYVHSHMGAKRLGQSTRPLRVVLSFYRATARNADIDNLSKFVFDALQMEVDGHPGAIKNDSQIVEMTARKQIDRAHPRTVIEITEIPAEVQP